MLNNGMHITFHSVCVHAVTHLVESQLRMAASIPVLAALVV